MRFNYLFSNIVGNYISYIQDQLRRSPSTITNEMIQFRRFLKWFVNYRNNRSTIWTVNRFELESVFDEITNQLKPIKKEHRKRKSTAMDTNVQVSNRLLPSGGLQTLIDQVESEWEWLNRIDWSMALLDKDIYDRFMMILYSSLYLFSPQGRISGILDMKLAQANELVHHGSAMSTKFKTSSSFGYQPVTVSSLSRQCLLWYLNNIRPKIKHHTSSSEYLFLKYNGYREDRGGDYVIYNECIYVIIL